MQRVDRHEHVARRLDLGCGGVADQQRADADQPLVAVDQGGAGEVRVGWRGEQRIGQEIFPVAGELPPAGELGLPAAQLAVAAQDEQGLADVDRLGDTEPDRLDVHRERGADQAQAGVVVVADDLGRDPLAIGGVEVDSGGLEDQVADGQDQPASVDDHPAAATLAPQRVGGAGVGRHLRLHADDGGHRLGRACLCHGCAHGQGGTYEPGDRSGSGLGHRAASAEGGASIGKDGAQCRPRPVTSCQRRHGRGRIG